MNKIRWLSIIGVLVIGIWYSYLSYQKEKEKDSQKAARLAWRIAFAAVIIGLLPVLGEAFSSGEGENGSTVFSTEIGEKLEKTYESTATSNPTTVPSTNFTETVASNAPAVASTLQPDIQTGEDETINRNDWPVIQGTSFSGELKSEDQEDAYSYIAPVSGKYRFNLDSSDAQTTYKFFVYTQNNSEICETKYSSYNSNNGKTIELEAGQKYRIYVKQDSGYLQYMVSIGVPNEIKNVEGTSMLGCISYIDQEDNYLYVAPRTGLYYFDFGTDNVESTYYFKMYKLNNETIVSTSSRNEGKSIELEGGETYKIVIAQSSGNENYNIQIGVPNAMQIVEENIICERFTYRSQQNIYLYTAPYSGRYQMSFEEDDVQCNYKIRVYSPINETLLSTSNKVDNRKLEMIEGQTYKVEIQQCDGYPEYKITIVFLE